MHGAKFSFYGAKYLFLLKQHCRFFGSMRQHDSENNFIDGNKLISSSLIDGSNTMRFGNINILSQDTISIVLYYKIIILLKQDFLLNKIWN